MKALLMHLKGCRNIFPAAYFICKGDDCMSMINISNLTFAYENSYDYIFKNVSFKLDTNWKVGFVGRNGRGKTTLLKLLLGEFDYTGTISSDIDFEYFPYHVKNTEQFTIDVIKDICPSALDWEIYRELSILNVSEKILYQQYSSLSYGEQAKAMLAGLFLRHNNFLLIDEPTNHLDIEGRKHLADYLKRKKGFILISHDRAFLDACTNYTLSINKCNIELQKGSFSSWMENKEKQDAFEIAKNEKLKKDIKHLEKASKRTAEWSDKAEARKIGFDPLKVEKSSCRRAIESRKSKKMMSRSKALSERRQQAIDEKSQLLKNIETTAELKLSPLKFYTNKLLQLDKISIKYSGNEICSDVSFIVTQGDRIALFGKNGCGKSSILKLIIGDNIEYSGKIIKNHQLKISYVSQNTQHLKGSLKEYADSLGIELSLFLSVLRKLDFSRSQFEKRIEDLSDGQKKKVLIAGSLCENAHLYIWDEPLNFIDIISRIQIEELIKKYTPTMIFVEHDETFRNNIANKVIHIE